MNRGEYLSETACKRWNGSAWERSAETLANECRLGIRVNGRTLAECVCSPVELEELVVGRLCTEGIIRGLSQITALRFDEKDFPERIDAFVSVSESGAEAPKPQNAETDAEGILKLYDFAIRNAEKNRSGHSLHSCTLLYEGEILCSCEDISRHNAIDRAAGRALRLGADPVRCTAYLSGRISAEAVRRAAAAGFPALCGKGLPTAQAVALAREKGLLLLHCSEKRGLISF